MIQTSLAWLQRKLSAPIYPEDEEKTALASLLQAYVLSLGLLELVALPASLIFFSARLLSFGILLGVTCFTWLCWFAVRRGYVRQVAQLVLAAFWLITTGLVAISGGMQSLDWSFYIPGTVAAALFFGIPGALQYSLASLAAGLIFVLLDLNGFPLPRIFPFPPFSGWLLLIFNLSMTLLPITIYLHRLQQALAAARQELAERQRIQSEIAHLNEALEQRVQQRTAELEATNREIESYSYSVSHDLRAPIRSIVGFTQIVLAAYRDQLPPEAQRDLEHVRQSGFQMAQVVDGFLEYLSIRNKDLLMQSVDMKALAAEAWEDLRFGHEEAHPISFVLSDLPGCRADPELTKLLWLKLLDNAIKFTHHPLAHIEIGSQPGAPGAVYYVRDNGAGFDMRYAEKAFGVFQRLHRAEEYQGAGIGLAIAKRITEHHRGRIWVESAPGQGATFFFTLAE